MHPERLLYIPHLTNVRAIQMVCKEADGREEHASEIINQIEIVGDIPGHSFCPDNLAEKNKIDSYTIFLIVITFESVLCLDC